MKNIKITGEMALVLSILMLIFSILAYYPYTLFIAAGFSVISCFTGEARRQTLFTIFGGILIFSSLLTYFLLNTNVQDILIYYLPIFLPLLFVVKKINTHLSKSALTVVVLAAILFRIDDYSYLAKLVLNHGFGAWSVANLNQFTDQDLFGLNRFFVAQFFFLILSILFKLDKRIVIGIALWCIFLVVFYFSRLLIIGIFISFLLYFNAHTKKGISVSKVVIPLALMFLLVEFGLQSVDIMALNRIEALMEGNDTRVGFFVLASECMVTFGDFATGNTSCIAASGLSDIDSLFMDLYFRGGAISLSLFLGGIFFISLLPSLIKSNGKAPTLLGTVFFLLLYNYDSSMTKPEFWAPIVLFELSIVALRPRT